ncbi:hypothetical protein ACHAXA_000401, partial [Cyclostephanos tholiformis]
MSAMLNRVDGGDGGEIDAASLGNNSVDSSFFNRVRSIDSNVAIMAFEYLVGNGKLSMEDADEAIRLAAGGGANANANDGAMDAAGHGPVGGGDVGGGGGGKVTPSSSFSSSYSNNNGASGHAIITKAKTDSTGTSRRRRRLRADATKTTRAHYRTRHVALQFSYDGTEYSGYAQNVGVLDDNSVEKDLFAALERTNLLVMPVMVEEVDGGRTTNVTSARAASMYSRCGRTDRGVHAHGQVIALRLKSAFPPNVRLANVVVGGEEGGGNVATDVNVDDPSSSWSSSSILDEDALPRNSIDGLDCFVPPSSSAVRRTIVEYDYPRILNGVLPPAIRVLGWCPVTSEFSARFSCRERTYRYFFPRRNLDLDLMACGLRYMMGKHDFRNLCKMNVEQVYNFERVLIRGKVVSPQVVHEVRAHTSDDDDDDHDDASAAPPVSSTSMSTMSPSPRDMCHVEIVGRAFLWHQIRCIMSVLFYVGRKLESPTLVRDLLDVDANPAKPSYEMASEAPLVLHRCSYGNNLTFGRTVRNLWDATKVLERRWEGHAISAERARDELDSLRAETEVRWTDLMDFVERIADGRRGARGGRRGQRAGSGANDKADGGDVRSGLIRRRGGADTISWGSAVEVIEGALAGVHPHPPSGCGGHLPRGQTESSVHVPIMERSRGTTYEEKVRSILSSSGEGAGGGIAGGGDRVKSSKRKERYEENIIRKRKTAEEDKAFYDRMLRQGGSSSWQ